LAILIASSSSLALIKEAKLKIEILKIIKILNSEIKNS